MNIKLLGALMALVLTAAIAGTAAPTASAATTYPVNETVTIGTTEITVAGTATILNFAASGDSVTATANFTGTVTVTDTTTGASFSLPVNATLSADVSNIDADCAGGTVTFDILATLTLTQPFTETYTFGPTTVTINAGSNQLVGNLICQIQTLLGNDASTTAVVKKLNATLKKA